MRYNPEKHHRRSIRLRGHDYAGGGIYFVTLCTHQRHRLFGKIIDGEMQLNDYGQIVSKEWVRSQEIRPEINVDAWVVMPDHFHAIVIIQPPEIPHPIPQRTGIAYRKPRSLSSLIAGFKSATTKQINLLRNAPGTPVWQRNYHERIVRDERAFQCIRRYIENNPMAWWQKRSHSHPPSP